MFSRERSVFSKTHSSTPALSLASLHTLSYHSEDAALSWDVLIGVKLEKGYRDYSHQVRVSKQRLNQPA